MRFFQRRRCRPPKPERRHSRFEGIRNVLAVIGAATVLYLFVTQILMRLLAWMTVQSGGAGI